MRTLDTISRRAGFTLLEILAVVSILSVLLGIVLSAIHAAQNQSKRAIARAEVRSVESALKAYLDHYGNWSLLANAPTPPFASSDTGDRFFVLDSDVAAALEGVIADNANAKAMNPDGQPFLEFSRHMSVGDKRRVPVNPWEGQKGVASQENASAPARGDARFWVAIDHDFDGVVDLKTLGLTSDAYHMPRARTFSSSSEQGDTIDSVARPVVVWTYNPWTYDVKAASGKNERGEAIVSWME